MRTSLCSLGLVQKKSRLYVVTERHLQEKANACNHTGSDAKISGNILQYNTVAHRNFVERINLKNYTSSTMASTSGSKGETAVSATLGESQLDLKREG